MAKQHLQLKLISTAILKTLGPKTKFVADHLATWPFLSKNIHQSLTKFQFLGVFLHKKRIIH